MKLPQLLQKNTTRGSRFWVTLVVILIIIIAVRHCSFNFLKNTKKPTQVVVSGKVEKTNIAVYLDALGTVTPTYTVTVKTQINGQLQQVLFKEGQSVKAGDLLAQIDPRPYEAQLIQYEGQLARDNALLANAQMDLARYQKLWQQNSVAKQILDTQVSLVKQDEGTVRLDEGLIETTKVNLNYCRITSPIDGRVGLRLVDPGNLVQTSDTSGIAVINMLSPITVIFPIAEDYVPSVQQEMNTGKTILAKAYDRQQEKLLAVGSLLTMDNQIDPTTGTVKLKATFPNTDNQLFPSQFVNIKLLVTTLLNATIVPTTAIQHGTQGDFVYVIKPDNTVASTPVKTGVTDNENTCILSGVTPGQLVVVQGADKLTNGAEVSVAGANISQSKSGKHGSSSLAG